jgi:hypothetical protein
MSRCQHVQTAAQREWPHPHVSRRLRHCRRLGAESLDIALDTLRAGRAFVMLAGGNDDFGEEGSYEFAQMGATSSAAAGSEPEAAAGREPSEMCRPMAWTRGGFMEAQGAGMQVGCLTAGRCSYETVGGLHGGASGGRVCLCV